MRYPLTAILAGSLIGFVFGLLVEELSSPITHMSMARFLNCTSDRL